YPSNAQDVSALLTAIKGKNPHVVLGSGHLQDSLLIVKQSKDLGVSPRAMGFSVGPSSPEFRENLKGTADYIFGATQWTESLRYTGDDPWKTPKAFGDAFRVKHPNYKSTPYQVAESAVAVVAYQRAIEKAGTLDPTKVRDALAELDLMTYYGRVKFDARGVNIFKPMAVEQYQPDGNKYTVWPVDVAEKPALYPMPAWDKR
nr:ABC transporter substrate-binding protein [Acidobacteriota bacterium]